MFNVHEHNERATTTLVCGASAWVFVSLLLFPSSCFCLFVSAHFVLLTLLQLRSVFRALAVCCCASSCAAAGDDSPRSRNKCFCACNLVDVTNTHTYRCLLEPML